MLDRTKNPFDQSSKLKFLSKAQITVDASSLNNSILISLKLNSSFETFQSIK